VEEKEYMSLFAPSPFWDWREGIAMKEEPSLSLILRPLEGEKLRILRGPSS